MLEEAFETKDFPGKCSSVNNEPEALSMPKNSIPIVLTCLENVTSNQQKYVTYWFQEGL
jgi:hypothetical protein